ncbi:MAG: hypothetical protein DHS20C15_13470 [Planctomycetota bacterium]|nr:MAG: hypothetical protein DHS20C15_13470 [Planctomycetota bacterium]
MFRARLLLVAALLAPACALTPTPPPAQNEMDWVGDEMLASTLASPARVLSAAALAFERAGLDFVDSEPGRTQCRLVVRFGDGRRVVLRAERRTDGGSQLALKVGLAGDELTARQLLGLLFGELHS